MAKLTGVPFGQKGLALNRSLKVVVSRGQLIASAWPKKRGKPKSQVTRDQNEWFRQANILAKYADGDAQWMAIEITKGGPLYPRDVMMSAMAGRLFETLEVDGVEYTAVAVRDDVSHDIDLLAGKDLGTLLLRGPDTWQALIPGTSGKVLTSNGPAVLPSYQPGAGSASAFYFQSGSLATKSSSANATKGTPFLAARDFTVYGIAARVDAVSGEEYVGRILAVSDIRQITAIEGSSPTITIATTAAQYIWAAFAAPINLLAGSKYAAVFSRIDGTDVSINPMYFAPPNEGVRGMPTVPFGILSDADVVTVLAKKVPAVLDVMTDAGAFAFFLGMSLLV